MNPLQAAQLADGIVLGRAAAHVELHHLVALARRIVFNAHRNPAAGRGPLRSKPRILEFRIAEAEAEAVQRIAL